MYTFPFSSFITGEKKGLFILQRLDAQNVVHGSGASSITWKLIRNAESQAPPWAYWPRFRISNKIPRHLMCTLKFEKRRCRVCHSPDLADHSSVVSFDEFLYLLYFWYIESWISKFH